MSGQWEGVMVGVPEGRFGFSGMLASHCAKVDPRCTHEYVLLASTSQFLLHAKDFPMSPEVEAKVGETQLGFMQWHTIGSRMSQCFHDVLLFVYLFTSELWESVRPA